MQITIDFTAMKKFFLTKGQERSTWIGLIAVLSGAGITMSPETAELIAAAGSTIAGLILIISNDKKAAPAETEMGAGKE